MSVCNLVAFFFLSPFIIRSHSALPPVTLVISHCKHDLYWLKRMMDIFDVKQLVIYSKCGYPVIGAPARASIKRLLNVGRCDHTYAHFISELSLHEGIVFFLKDTNHVHWLFENKVKGREKGVMATRSYESMYDIAAGNDQFACRQYFQPDIGISNNVVTKQLLRLRIPQYNYSFYNYSQHNTQQKPFAIHPNMLTWTKEVGISIRQPLAPICYGGIFAVNVKRLLAIPKRVWDSVQISLSRANNIQEGHFMERAWAGMLSLEPIEAFDKPALCFKQNVCGYRGHIIYSQE